MAAEASERRRKQSVNPKGSLMALGIAAFLVLVLGGVVLRLFEWEKPTLVVDREVTVLGQKTKIGVTIGDGRTGLREFRAVVHQGAKEMVAVDRQLTRSHFFAKGVPSLAETIEINAQALGLHDGPAELLLSVRDLSWWQWSRGNQTVNRFPVDVDTKPPLLRVIDTPIGIKNGGSGVVVYGANKEIVEHGLTINGIFYPGFAVPNRKDVAYAAMIGLPYDTEAIKEAVISGSDRAGNQARLPVSLKLRPVKKRSDNITLSDDFLNTKIPEFAQYYPALTTMGDTVKQFLFVNNEVRKQNAAKIAEVCAHPDQEQHWQGAFQRMERSSPMAGFAQYRTYYYHDKPIDNQVHLGVDLASLQRAEMGAANNGKVVFADYLGIYGNMVILDHGLGLFSLYSHMSEIRAQVGTMVNTGDVLGLTGKTGMAGGDHLHFAMLINGIFVTPVEWWDEHWIKDNILLFLQGAKTGQSK